jgi:hypothetical protein
MSSKKTTLIVVSVLAGPSTGENFYPHSVSPIDRLRSVLYRHLTLKVPHGSLKVDVSLNPSPNLSTNRYLVAVLVPSFFPKLYRQRSGCESKCSPSRRESGP